MNTNENLSPAAVTSAKVRAVLAGVPQQPTTEQVDRWDATDRPIPFSLTSAAEQLPRRATVSVRGVLVDVQCPSWCVSPHTEKLNFIEDLTHTGEAISLPVRQFDGSVEQVLTAQLVQWPFADKSEPYMSVDADGSGECNEYHGPAGLAFADQLVAHAERIRAEVAKLNGGRS
ncbi:DUF6907 domain-containing protein [Streptomyces sp. ME19-01-6]|uniref:DUF6907 domain-containing protein n=1 Tax=Streptomyces sp. ME19-01-6 TaxID=3028686 RepID=UPI0029AA0E12|nr:hypothetical protein [Streptomyces sp. ME19-01-6]MDX3229385.1 hypothetical protein [Streptomyces sp. ME19-01-6]